MQKLWLSLVKLSPDLDRIIYSTFLGGDSDDNGRAGCIDKDGNMIVAGSTSGGNLPIRNAFQDSYKGSGDAFVAKLSIEK